jgi:hypothetical protein
MDVNPPLTALPVFDKSHRVTKESVLLCAFSENALNTMNKVSRGLAVRL